MNHADEVIGRLAFVTNSKTDTQLAENIGVSANTISTWKKRGKIPYEQCMDVADRYTYSLDWLLTGKGDPCPNNDAGIGKRLQQIREVEGEGLQGAAAKMGVDVNVLKAWEDGEEPICLDNAARFCLFNGYSIDFLVTGKGGIRAVIETKPAPALDIETAQVIIEEVEKFLNEMNRQMEPEKKSLLIRKIYEFYHEDEEKPKRDNVIQLVRAVAGK